MARALIALLLLIPLQSCQFGYEVVARYDGDKLVLDSKRGGWFGPDPCIIFDFSVLDGDRTIWSIKEKAPDDRKCPPGGDFPLTYGVAPRGFATAVKAEPLVSGHVYRISGGSGIHYSGSFRVIARTVYDVTNFPAG